MYEGEDAASELLENENIIAEHYGSRDWKRIVYVLLFIVISILFALFDFITVFPDRYRIPLGLGGVGGVIVVLLLVGRYRLDVFGKLEWGSYIDVPRRRIIWWDCPPPRIERSIEIGELARISFDNGPMESSTRRESALVSRSIASGTRASGHGL